MAAYVIPDYVCVCVCVCVCVYGWCARHTHTTLLISAYVGI